MDGTEKYYRHILRLGREMAALLPRFQTEAPLSRTERGVLAILCCAEAEGTRVISAQIAQRLDVTRSAVSQAVDKLENAGYVLRTSSDTDRKIAYIELTPEAKARFDVRAQGHKELFGRVFSRMGEDAVREFLTLAERFVDAVREERKNGASSEDGHASRRRRAGGRG